MEDIQAVFKVMQRQGFFVMKGLPSSCPVCGKTYLKKDLPETGMLSLLCMSCHHHETFTPLRNGRFVTDGQLRVVNG